MAERFTLARTLAARVITATVARLGKARYSDPARAAVLTPLDSAGVPMWRTDADSGSKTRDAVVRVYAAAQSAEHITVHIGGHPAGINGTASWQHVEFTGSDAATRAEQQVTMSVYALLCGEFTTDTLAKAVPANAQLRACYVERPDYAAKAAGKRKTAAAVDADALATSFAALAAQFATQAETPADITPAETPAAPAETPAAPAAPAAQQRAQQRR